MTTENEDVDNFWIADKAMSHERFPSENEDVDNMRRVTAAGVPLSTPGLPWNLDSSPGRTTGVPPCRCRQSNVKRDFKKDKD